MEPKEIVWCSRLWPKIGEHLTTGHDEFRGAGSDAVEIRLHKKEQQQSSDLIILNLDQEIRMTPELAPQFPNFYTTPTSRVSSQNRFNVPSASARGRFSVISGISNTRTPFNNISDMFTLLATLGP
ncbi:hypothetical protein TNCV_5076911 [Trichonephila clavipes]|uniref:Uncharacterized protein n=1 Tax=Trichonephila clavipes TaxID=2585209 RepID=A0A8X6VBA8_TRICX|nr:hypothetical protein TNCV_5076911 [Trichonephila clavipes]